MTWAAMSAGCSPANPPPANDRPAMVGDGRPDTDVGIALPEGGQQLGQQVLARHGAGGQGQLAGQRLLVAADLGAGPLQTFLQVTLPLTLPGIAAGSLLVLIPAVGEFVIPDLLGGPDTLMIGKVLWDEFFNNRDWPVAAAVAVVLVAALAVPLLAAQRFFEREHAA